MVNRGRGKKYLHMLFDILGVNAALFLAFYFRYGKTVFDNLGDQYVQLAILTTVVFFISFYVFKFYHTVWYYASLHELFYGVVANVFAGFLLLSLQVVLRQTYLPLILLATILSVGITLGGRMAYRVIKQLQARQQKRRGDLQKVLIVGGGSGGTIAIKELQTNKNNPYYPVAAVDDDENLHGKVISGVPVMGGIDDLTKVAREKDVDVILISIPSLSEKRKREILQLCKTTGKTIKSMPGIYHFHSDEEFFNNIKDVDPEELLGKTDLPFDEKKIRDCAAERTVLITGAAGVMGATIAKLLTDYQPKTLVLLDVNEKGLLDLYGDLKKRASEMNIVPLVTSIKDEMGIQRVLKAYMPDVIIHGAFHNNEDFTGGSPSEVIRNNIFGTYYLMQGADRLGLEKMILLSHDEALRPNGIIGATKRIAEMMVQGMSIKSTTKFSAIRFGDLNENAYYYLDRFKEEMKKGGPLTIEHQELTRYFATKKDAAKLILEAAHSSQGGEIFSLDLGKPMKMADLAKEYAELAGYRLGEDLELLIEGDIKEEQIRQEFIEDPDGLNETRHQRIFTTRTSFDNYVELKEKIDDLRLVLDKGEEDVIRYQVVKTVKDLIPNFYHLTFDEAAFEGRSLTGDDVENKRIWLSSPHLGGLERHYVNEAFDTNWVAPVGPNVNEFENEVGRYVRASSAAAMTTGTAALHIALRLLGVKEGDSVFCSSLTFAGSCNPIMYENALPVFIDSEPESWNMSPVALEKAFLACQKEEKLPKAVIVVNLYGQSADFDQITEICDRYGVPIIEDAAESLGATYKNRQTGTFGKFGVFSFNGNKIITSSGGGMLVSHDDEAIQKSKFMITQARDQARHYQHSELGFNYRMSNIVAGVGRGQLKVLELRIKRKKEIFTYYKEAFKDIDSIEMMPIADFGEPNYWLSAMTIDENSPVKPIDLMLALEKEDIESRPVWKPMHMQPYYEKYPFYSHYEGRGSVAEELFQRGVCMPSDTKMTDRDLERVTGIVRGLFGMEGKKVEGWKVGKLEGKEKIQKSVKRKREKV